MQLAYDRRGEGEPLLLIHGVGMDRRVWQPVLGALNDAGFQTFAIDAPGFGASPALPDDQIPTIEVLAGAVAGFLEDLGLERAHMVGNSMGGGIALELARAGRAHSVTAISPVGLWTRRELRFCQICLRVTFASIGLAPDLFARGAANPIIRTLLGSQVFARPWRIPPQQMRAVIHALAGATDFDRTVGAFEHYTLRDCPQLADLPVTIAWGERDHLLLARQAERGRRLLAHARHVWLRGLGHVPMWDDPALVTATIIAGAGTA